MLLVLISGFGGILFYEISGSKITFLMNNLFGIIFIYAFRGETFLSEYWWTREPIDVNEWRIGVFSVLFVIFLTLYYWPFNVIFDLVRWSF
jgi:hypothetical protein